MNESLRWILFYVTMTLLVGGVDVYVLRTWRKFVRERAWSRWFYHIPALFACLMLPVFLLVLWWRRVEEVPGPVLIVLLSLVSLWYLPKFPIALVLLIKDLLRLLRAIGLGVLHLLRGAKQAVPDAEAHAAREASLTQRRHFLQTAGWSLASVPFMYAGYGLLRTALDFEVQQVEIPLARLARALDGLRIAQISDVHAGSFFSSAPAQEICRVVNATQADVVVITGDFVNFNPNELERVFPALGKLKADLGVYGCLGNHDHYMSAAEHVQLQRAIREAGIDLLVNENRILSVNGGHFQLAGIDNIGLRQSYGDLNTALGGLNREEAIVLLAHDPTYWDKGVRGKTPVDLMLSGHTHGGQFGVHLLGREYSVAQIVYEQWAGLYSAAGQHLYVNRGLGTTGFPIRTGIAPEITLMTLRAV